jgi:hypothetical protein
VGILPARFSIFQNFRGFEKLKRQRIWMEKGVGFGCFEKALKWAMLQDDQVVVTKQMLKKTKRGGKI